MAKTYEFISEGIVGPSGATTITLNNIPQTFTDLVLKCSLRTTLNNGFTNYNWVGMRVNNNSSLTYVVRALYGSNNSTGSLSRSDTQLGQHDVDISASATSNTFSNSDYYFSDYTSSTSKSGWNEGSAGANSSSWAGIIISSLEIPLTTGITSISVYDLDANLTQYSSASLYGIKKS